MRSSLRAFSPALARWWEGASARERRGLVGAATVVLLAAAWVWVWEPMTADVERMQRDRARAARVLATAQAQAAEMAGLARAAPPTARGDPRVAVERISAERGLRAAVSSLTVEGQRVRVSFASVRFDALVGLLAALAQGEGLWPVEATITSRVEPGTVRAEITVGR
jgi:type II secretory pathway component PulM